MKRRLLSLLGGGTGGLALALLINAASTRLLAIVALVTVLVLLVILAGVALGLARFWLQVAPQVTPLLSMFAPPAVGAEPAGGADSGRVVAPPAATHTVTHAPECAIFDERPCDCANTPQ